MPSLLRAAAQRCAATLLFAAAFALPAAAQSYEDIDVDLPEMPALEPIPDSPVYYAPAVESNYFYYDGLYWDYFNDRWYASTWYNGPWSYVDPVYVPTYVLWVPIRYYRRPPAYFHRWATHRPPRWGEHWGRDWQVRHNQVYNGPRGAPVRAPLPLYQREYTRQNYPRNPHLQAQLHGDRFSYRPRESIGRDRYERRDLGGNHRGEHRDGRDQRDGRADERERRGDRR